jgi:hypothetical protein
MPIRVGYLRGVSIHLREHPEAALDESRMAVHPSRPSRHRSSGTALSE